MDNAIQFPEDYRYDSDIELFKIAVEHAKEMFEKGEMIIVYQFIDIISAEVYISQDEFEKEYDGISWNDFNDILNDEIIFLLRQSFEEVREVDIGLKKYLKEQEIPEEQQEGIIKLKLEKYQYVRKVLGGEREKNRYNLKKHSFLKKLSDIDYEVSRTIDEEEILYAAIKMSVSPTLEFKNMDIPKAASYMFSQGKEDITFLCDKADIEYLIHILERIKQMI